MWRGVGSGYNNCGSLYPPGRAHLSWLSEVCAGGKREWVHFNTRQRHDILFEQRPPPKPTPQPAAVERTHTLSAPAAALLVMLLVLTVAASSQNQEHTQRELICGASKVFPTASYSRRLLGLDPAMMYSQQLRPFFGVFGSTFLNRLLLRNLPAFCNLILIKCVCRSKFASCI